MKAIILLLVSTTLLLAVCAISAQNGTGQAEVIVLNEQNWDDAAPRGKEVDAIYGDIVLRNDFVTAVIAQPLPTRNANMTVKSVGGCLIDLTDRTHQSDQLSCYFPGRREYPLSRWSATATDGTQVTVTPELKIVGDTASVTVRSEGNENRCSLEVIYSLTADSHALQITSKYINETDTQKTFSILDEIRADGGKDEMVKSPNGETNLFTLDDRFWQQAYGVTTQDHTIQCDSNTRTSSLKYLDKSGNDLVSVKPGDTHQNVIYMTTGPTLLHVRSNLSETPVQVVKSVLKDGAAQPIADCQVEFLQNGQSLGIATSDAQGYLEVPLEPGEYDLVLNCQGVRMPQDFKYKITSEQTAITTIIPADYMPGIVVGTIVDENNVGTSCKVEFIGKDKTPTPDFAPVTAEFMVKNLRYSPHGNFKQKLLPGTYDVIISHGAEYDAIFTELTVEPGKEVDLNGTLKRTVATPGWVSGEFHSHSSPSGDNTGSQLGRVLNLVCEHLEFAPCTEHNRISTYQPHIDELKIGTFISTVSGMELTGSPLPLNHQNTFPLHHHPHRQDGGGPQTDIDPEKQIRRIAAWDNGSEKLIQQNHPDIGWLYYDQDGNGEHDHGHAGSFDFIDAMEIHPIDRSLVCCKLEGVTSSEAKGNRIFKWLQLLNQGHRMAGVVNTDAHYNFHGSGWLRNWIQSSTDDPAKIDHMEMVHASEEGRLVMSNGPFLEVLATTPNNAANVTFGQDILALSGEVELHIRVQCPNWHDIDTVCVLVNGAAQKRLIFSRNSNPNMFNSDQTALKFDQKISVQLKQDSHLVVVTGNTKTTLGPVMGPEGGNQHPAAVGNPIFVDIDDNGFTPNKDTLGLPLPVKGD